MTVGNKLHQTLASLESVKADMASFTLDTQDVNAKKMYSDFEDQLGSIISGLKGRVNYAEQQEPQYKVKDQIESQMRKQ